MTTKPVDKSVSDPGKSISYLIGSSLLMPILIRPMRPERWSSLWVRTVSGLSKTS